MENNHANCFIDYGPDKELYRYNYQLDNARSADDYSAPFALGSVFAQSGAALYQRALEVMDVDQWVRTFAAQSLIGNDDTVGQLYPHNFKIYDNPETGLIMAAFTDLDRAFRVSTSAPLWGSATQIDRLFEIPQVSRLFFGHVDHLIQENFNSAYLNDWASEYASYFGGSSPANYVQTRANYIQNNLLPALAPFNITTNAGNNFSVATSQATLEGTGSYKIRELYADGLSEPLNVTWLDDTDWQVTLNLNPGTNNVTIRAHDYFGNEIHSDAINVTSTDDSALARDFLRVTEINYHPADPTAAELSINPALDDNDFEFIELLNTSATQSINLAGVHFIEQVFSDDNQGITFTFGDIDLAAGQRVVLVGNTAGFQTRYGTGVEIAGEYSGKLDNGGETITLRDATGQTIQQFTYDDDAAANWPTPPDGNGPTLVAIDTAGDYDASSNWAASSITNGTPGSAEAAGLVGDLNDDGYVGAPDLQQLLIYWGDDATSSAGALAADLNNDGTVNTPDLNIVLANFGQCSAPTTPTSNDNDNEDNNSDVPGDAVEADDVNDNNTPTSQAPAPEPIAPAPPAPIARPKPTQLTMMPPRTQRAAATSQQTANALTLARPDKSSGTTSEPASESRITSNPPRRFNAFALRPRK